MSWKSPDVKTQISSEVAERIVREQPCEVPLTQVGELVAELGLWSRQPGGKLVELAPLGYEH